LKRSGAEKRKEGNLGNASFWLFKNCKVIF